MTASPPGTAGPSSASRSRVAAHELEPLVQRARIGRRAGAGQPRGAHAGLRREAPTCSALAAVPNARWTPPAAGTASAIAVATSPAPSPSAAAAAAAAAGAPAVQVACQPAA